MVLNRNQLRALWGGIIIAVVIILLPPPYGSGWRSLNEYVAYQDFDVYKQSITAPLWAIALVTGGLLVTFHKKENQ